MQNILNKIRTSQKITFFVSLAITFILFFSLTTFAFFSRFEIQKQNMSEAMSEIQARSTYSENEMLNLIQTKNAKYESFFIFYSYLPRLSLVIGGGVLFCLLQKNKLKLLVILGITFTLSLFLLSIPAQIYNNQKTQDFLTTKGFPQEIRKQNQEKFVESLQDNFIILPKSLAISVLLTLSGGGLMLVFQSFILKKIKLINNLSTVHLNQSFQILKKNWPIYAISILFLVGYTLSAFLKFSSLFKLLMLLLSLGWLGTKYVFIMHAVENKPLPWKEVATYFIKYMKKLLPVSFLIGFILLLVTIGYVILYSKWYFEFAPLSGDISIRSQQIVEMAKSIPINLKNPKFERQFFVYFASFEVISVLFFQLRMITLIILSTDEKKITTSARKGVSFFKNNFLIFFITFLIVLLLFRVSNFLSITFFGSTVYPLITILSEVIQEFIYLLIAISLMSHYLNTKEKKELS